MKFASAIVCAVGLLAATQAAAVPEIVTYAARVENDAGPFTGTASVTFQLFTDPVAGTEVFVETVASLVIVGGDLIHDLGSTTALDDVLDENDALFLQVTLNGETLEPRTPIRSVPWAIRASEADIAQSAVSATDAARLGGQLPSAFQFGVAANGGLAVANNQFSIANDAITSARIAAGAVGTADIAANAVTSGLIADGAVGTADIANGAINAAKLVASAVGLAQLAANSVDATPPRSSTALSAPTTSPTAA